MLLLFAFGALNLVRVAALSLDGPLHTAVAGGDQDDC